MQSLKNRFITYIDYIRYRGILSSLLLLFNTCIEYIWFISHRGSGLSLMDFTLKEETLDNQKHSTFYVPTPIIPFFKLIKKLQLPNNSVFVDYGAGKGRAMILAAESHSFKKIKGLEFSASLYKSAKKNIQTYVKKTGSDIFDLHHTDVVNYQVQSEDNIFYFFNPFNEHILKQCLGKMQSSLNENPRRPFLIYQSYLKDKTKCITENSSFVPFFSFVYLSCRFYVYHFNPLKGP